MRLADSVDALARRLPDDDPRRGEFRARIAALANDCGCTMGGIFLVAATVLAIGYFVLGGRLGIGQIAIAIGFALLASFVGKGVGLGIARLRLLWLRRALTARLRASSAPSAPTVEVSRVDVH
jgi:hypothetical protein